MPGDKTIHHGVIKFFSYKRGYGFIIPHDSPIKEDVFFHFSAISNDPGIVVHLIPNERVQFELLRGPRGFLAHNVTSNTHKVGDNKQPINITGGENRNKVSGIYHHYFYSLKKIMDTIVKDQIKSIEKKE